VSRTTYKVSNEVTGEYDFVSASSMSQAIIAGISMYGHEDNFTVSVASADEANALMRSHSLPSEE
jgi:hypothetical protein